MIAVMLSLVAAPGFAQNAYGGGTEFCRSVNGRLVCHRIAEPRTTGTRSWEQWPGGQPAGPSGSSTDNSRRATGSWQMPQSWGMRNGPYGMTR